MPVILPSSSLTTILIRLGTAISWRRQCSCSCYNAQRKQTPLYKRIEVLVMAYFLAKTDPGHYSIDNLEQDKLTVWDGVRNAAALLIIRAMRPGDEVLIYHSQGESAIVGLARVVSEPRPAPNEPNSWVVDSAVVR